MGEYIKIAARSDIAEGEGACFEVRGKTIAVFRCAGNFLAIDDECTHAGASLSEGYLDGEEVECPWHAARFNLRTGEACAAPADEPVSCYKVRVTGEDIEVEV